jgi:peptide/nickel transport system substrate-binding protein
MRRWGTVVLLVCAVLEAAGLGGVGAGPAQDTLVVARNINDIITLDPAVAYEFSGILAVQNVYDTLVAFEGEDLSRLRPRLATSWTIQDAGTSWKVTFRLRPGVRFSTGRPLEARAVVSSVQRVIALNKSPAFLFKDIAGLKEDSVRAPDTRTVEFTLPKSSSPQAFLSILAFSVGGVVDPDEVAAHQSGQDRGEAWLRDHSAGTGPYAVERWEPESQVMLVTNPNYWGTRPRISRVVIRHVPESSNQKFMLERGDADIANDLTPEQARELGNRPGVRIQRGRTLLLVYVGMNVGHKPLDDPKVREAVRWSIDYDGIVQGLLRGNAQKVQTIIPAGLFGHNPATPFRQDPSRARQLLREAGLPDGFSVELLTPTGAAPGGVNWADLGAKLQADLGKSGIRVTVRQTTQAELLNVYRAQKGQMVLILWGPDFPDPDGNVTPFTDYEAKSIAWRNQYRDEALARLAKQAALETNPDRRRALYRQITEKVLHEGPYAVLYQPTLVLGVRSDVRGFVWNPMGYAEFRTVTK